MKVDSQGAPGKRPSAVRSFGLAIGIGALFLAVIVGIAQLRGDGDLLRLFTRQDQTWQAMQSAGVWRVGMDPSFPPFQYLDDNGAVVGYDVDLARRMAEQWGLELEIVPLGYDSLLDALQAGRIDSVVSALPYDPRGTRDFAFSPPYFEAGIRLAVRADSPLLDAELAEMAAGDGATMTATNATSTEAAETALAARLSGLRLAVEWGSMGDMVGRRLRRADESVEIVPFETPNDAIVGLLDDASIDGLLIDNVSLRQAQGQGAALVAVGPALEGNAYVIAAPLRATTLQTQIADTLQTFAQVGEFSRLEDRWFGEMETVSR